RPFDAVIELPGSKSYSNRALLVAALARGRTEITRALFSDDTRYMQRALDALGVRVRADETWPSFVVDGVDGRVPASEATLENGRELVSAPYVAMTLSTMAELGVRAERDGDRWFRVPSGQHYAARPYAVEPDASGASYFFAAAAVTGGRVVVPRLGRRSAQGDLGLLDVLARMGCDVTIDADAITVRGVTRLRAVDADFTRMGDVATTLMAIAPFADGPVTVRGIAQTHYEESDRPVAAATELRRMGLTVDSSWDSVTIHP